MECCNPTMDAFFLAKLGYDAEESVIVAELVFGPARAEKAQDLADPEEERDRATLDLASGQYRQ